MSDSSESDGEDLEGPFSLEYRTNVDDTLTPFREQWHRELEISPQKEAKKLFLKGIEYEQRRQFYEAIQFYKRAVQLVPDIEFRLYESTKVKLKDKCDSDDHLENISNDITNNDDDKESYNDEDDEDDEDEESDLFIKLCKIVNRNKCVCFPKFEQNTTHISALPMELVLYILRWVVSSDLDLRSLEMFSRVCRGFYVSARDTEIWKLACIRVWGVNCGTYVSKYLSWRDMFLQRPRLRYNGCYISKISYIRHGESSFQDGFYRPFHLVEYFRYLRFFPEGKVLMLTSTDEAQSCVSSLRYRLPRNPSVLVGHYRLHDNNVTLVLQEQEVKSLNCYRRKKKDAVPDSREQTFNIQFEIQDHQRRINSQLKWFSYTIFRKYRNGHEIKMCLKDPSASEWMVSPAGGQYPPFKFSRVKSYTQESEAPL